MTGKSGPRSRKPRQAPREAGQSLACDAPILPDGYDPRTLDWWEGVLALPHAKDFGAGEWQVALRGAFVLELCWAKPSAAFLTEVRRIEAALGVTRGDRERLGIPEGKPPEPAGAKKPVPHRDRPDPRKSAS